jgi:FecR-like protein
MPGTKVIAMAAALLCLPAVATAQTPAVQTEESAGVVTTVNGEATLIRAVAAARPVSLQMRDEIFVRDRIHTQPRSLVRVLLGGKALITVRELSVLTVTEEAGRVTVDLQSGKIGVAVVKGRMRPGEVIEIRSPNATAAVRGTVFVVDVDPVKAGEAITTTRIHLFHGALDVSAHLDPSQPTVRLAELQSVVVAGNTLGSVRPLSRDAVAALTADLKPKQMQTKDAPDEFKSPLMAREQGRAVQLATALLPPLPGGPPPGVLKNVKGTVKGVTGVAGTLTDATAETLDRLMDTLGLGDTLVGGLVEGVGDTLQGTVGALGNTLSNTVGGVNTTLANTVGGLGGAVGGLTGTVGGLGGTVGGLGGTSGGSLGGTVGGLGGTVGGLGGTVGGLGGTVGGLGGAVGGLGGTLGGLGGPVGGTVGGLGGTVGGTVGGVGGTVGGVLGGLGGLLGGGN